MNVNTDAMLLCTCQAERGNTIFIIEAITPEARELLTVEANQAFPCSVTDLIGSEEVIKGLLKCGQTLQRQEGIFTFREGTPLVYSIVPLGKNLLLRLHETDSQVTEQDRAIGRHFQMASFSGICIFESVRNEQGEIEDMRLMYQNKVALENPFLGRPVEVDTLISQWYDGAKAIGQFEQFKKVVQTGQSFVMEKYYPAYDKTYLTSASKYRDGVIASFYNLTDRVKAEQTVRQQDNLLEQIMNNSYHFIMTWKALRNNEGVIYDFQPEQYNKAVIRSGMFTEEDFQTKTLLTLSPEAEKFLTHYTQVVETGTPIRLELPFQKEGRQFWFDLTVSKIGEGALSIFRDVTDRKRASMRLEEQNLFLESIINSSENSILVTKAVRNKAGAIVDFTITNVNALGRKYAKEVFGNDILGHSVGELTNNNLELFNEYVRIVETGQPITIDKRHYPAINKWFRVTIHKLGDGLVFTYIDVTEIQQSLIESQDKALMVQAVLDGSINGVLALAPLRGAEGNIVDFQIVLANEAAGRLCFLPTDEIIGKTYLELFPEILTTGFFEQFLKHVEQKSAFRMEWSFPSRQIDGFNWFDLSLTQANEELAILTFMNITEEVTLRQKQQNLLEELRLSNRNLEQFAYVASHDLQEPTRKIKSFGDLLMVKHAATLSPEGADIIRRMQSASSRMQELIDGLLSYSRFASHKAPHLQVALQEVLVNIVNDFELIIKEKNAVVTLGQLPIVRGDRVQLRQLFQNLISNALKFTIDSVPPHIIVEAAPPTPEELLETVGASSRKWHAIRVTDNGIGFDPIYRNRIFELFVRLHGRSQYTGNGLGLAICKRATELHGGGITVATTPGQGTTFTVILPAQG